MAAEYLTLPLTHVAYHHPMKGFSIAAKYIQGVNGITAEKSGKRVFVSALTGGVVGLVTLIDPRKC